MEKYKFIRSTKGAEITIEATSFEDAKIKLYDLVKDYQYWHYLK